MHQYTDIHHFVCFFWPEICLAFKFHLAQIIHAKLSFSYMASVISNIHWLLSILHCSNKSTNEYQMVKHWFYSAVKVSDRCQNYLSQRWLQIFFFTILLQLFIRWVRVWIMLASPFWCPSMQIVLDVCDTCVHQLWFPFHAIFNIEFCIAYRATNTHLYHIWWVEEFPS